MNIGKRIKYVRMLRGMRQEELAGKVGLGYNENGRTRISQYENGKRTPKEDMLEKISEALNVESYYTKEHTAILDFIFMLFDFDQDDLFNITKENERYLIDLDYNILLDDLMEEWMQKKADLRSGKISKEEYIDWKINYTG